MCGQRRGSDYWANQFDLGRSGVIHRNCRPASRFRPGDCEYATLLWHGCILVFGNKRSSVVCMGYGRIALYGDLGRDNGSGRRPWVYGWIGNGDADRGEFQQPERGSILQCQLRDGEIWQ